MPRPSTRSTRRVEFAERKNENKTQQKLLYVVIGLVGVLVIAVTFALMKGGDKGAAGRGGGEANAADSAMAPKAASTAGTPSSSTENDPVKARILELLLAIQEGDRDVLSRSINFPRWNDTLAQQGKTEKRWVELDSLGQTLARQKICESLIADEPTREFMRQSTVRSYVAKKQDATSAEILVIQQHLIETKREQERNFELARLDGVWFLVGMTASAIETPESMKAVADTVRATERSKRANRDLAPIEKQEFLADTPADVKSKIEGLCSKLADLSQTKEATKAKRELANLGKPAIPALLNLIVGHEELATKDDQMIVNNAVAVLKDITQEDLGYAPGGIGGTMSGDIKKENVDALMRWFGWWRDHKKSWTGPKAPEDK